MGNPEDAINAATSGDVVCLTGAFDVSHTYKNAQARNGVDNILFDLRTAGVTVDGSGATVTGDFDGAQNVVLLTNAGNTRLTGFTIDVGFIIVGSGIADVVIDFNSVHRAVFPNGNAGLIRSLGGTSAGTGNLTIADNTLGDMYACNGDDCPNSGTRASWESISDVLHLGCVTKQGAGGGTHVIDRNVLDGCASLIFFKHPDAAAAVFVRDNTFRNAQQTGKGGSVSVTPITSGNTYENVGDACGSCWVKDGS